MFKYQCKKVLCQKKRENYQYSVSSKNQMLFQISFLGMTVQ